MGVVVDSSVFIAKQRQRFDWHGWSASLGETEIFVAVITLSELLHGAHRAQTAEQRESRLRFASALERDYQVLAFGIAEAREHASLTAAMQRAGVTAGAHDLLIAATARLHGHEVSTLNATEFSRMPGVRVLDASPFRTAQAP